MKAANSACAGRTCHHAARPRPQRGLFGGGDGVGQARQRTPQHVAVQRGGRRLLRLLQDQLGDHAWLGEAAAHAAPGVVDALAVIGLQGFQPRDPGPRILGAADRRRGGGVVEVGVEAAVVQERDARLVVAQAVQPAVDDPAQQVAVQARVRRQLCRRNGAQPRLEPLQRPFAPRVGGGAHVGQPGKRRHVAQPRGGERVVGQPPGLVVGDQPVHRRVVGERRSGEQGEDQGEDQAAHAGSGFVRPSWPGGCSGPSLAAAELRLMLRAQAASGEP
jgi:hypothetical protein